MERNYTLEDFANNLEKIVEKLDSWSIEKVYRKDSGAEFRFLKWDRAHCDDVCPRNCFECHFAQKFGYEEFECEQLNIPYYVNQQSVGYSGDSYRGTMVFDLDKYYVEMTYSC